VTAPARPSTAPGRLIALLLAALVALAGFAALAGPANASSDEEARLFEATNQSRAQHGLAPLAYDPAAVGVARAWAEELARSGNLRHNPSLADRSTPTLPTSGAGSARTSATPARSSPSRTRT
jgi:uncharacterized protein YkwD